MREHIQASKQEGQGSNYDNHTVRIPDPSVPHQTQVSLTHRPSCLLERTHGATVENPLTSELLWPEKKNVFKALEFLIRINLILL